MLVKYWMSEPVITIDIEDTMQDVKALLEKHEIRMLPVMEKNKLVGVVTDRDVKRASASSASELEPHDMQELISGIKIKEVMTRDLFTVLFDLTVEEAAEIILLKKISGMPVVDHKGNLVGIITLSDLCRVMFSLTGFGKKGVQFAIQLSDKAHTLKEITDIIRSYGCRVSSILTSYDEVPDGHRKVFIRMFNIDRPFLERLIEEVREKATMLYIIDHNERKRMIF
ncbi:MAG: CBS domain-containing protein [Deltaproteobacteria bacterium]|nr:CBS domain-containing protein [Deltaproteobacteria bacterium]MBW2661916.1 CBS domain-containing protein [Deltaproteobacteria bacterium]